MEEASLPPSGQPIEAHPVESGVSSSMKSMGVLLTVLLGVFGFLYSLYLVATGATIGILISLGVLAATTLLLVVVYWPYRRRTALLGYEIGVAALWIGYFIGSTCLSSLVDIEWFCTIFWPWVILAVVGGFLLASPHERKGNTTTARRIRVCMLAGLVVAGGLLALGFGRLVLFENRPITAFLALRTFSLKDVAFSTDGNTLATIGGCNGEERIARLWDAATGTSKGNLRDEPDKSSEFNPKCVAVHFVNNPPSLAVASHSCVCGEGKFSIQLWDIKNQKVQRSFQWDDLLLVRRPVFSDDGNLFVYSGKGGHLRVFDLQAGRLTIDIPRSKENAGYIAITPTCNKLACATDDHKIEVWDVAQAKMERMLEPSRTVSSVGLSPDGRILAYGTENGVLEIVVLSEDGESCTVPCFDDGAVHSVAFSPDGTALACSGGERGLTTIIEMQHWKPITTLRLWGGWHIDHLAFSSDGKRLATGDALARVAVWDMMSLKGKQ
ncbi:MAG: WD40 repeat domain-containing protein [Thermoguttaceae bacterium]